MKHNGESLKLASYEDLFKNEETRQEEQQERVQMIATAEMDDFPNHPFQVCNDEKMRDTGKRRARSGNRPAEGKWAV